MRIDRAAVGQTHLAARMGQLAIPGAVRLMAETLRLAEGFVQVGPPEPIPRQGGHGASGGLKEMTSPAHVTVRIHGRNDGVAGGSFFHGCA